MEGNDDGLLSGDEGDNLPRPNQAANVLMHQPDSDISDIDGQDRDRHKGSDHSISDSGSAYSRQASGSDDDPMSDDASDFSVHTQVTSDVVDEERFNPLVRRKENEWKLSEGQEGFCNQYFSEYVSEVAIKDSILKSVPKPSLAVFNTSKLDPDIVDLLPHESKTPISMVDGGFRRVQGRLLDTMGPLAKLWSRLEAAKKGSGKCDLNKIMRLAEQAVIMVGQTNVLIIHNRRLNVLSRFLRDGKAATQILTQNQTVLAKNRKDLFGSAFYKALHRRAKGNKHRQEIKRELAPGSSQRHRPDRKRSGKKSFTQSHKPGRGRGWNDRKDKQPFQQPFQQGPSTGTYSSASRGAGRGGKRGRGFKPRYVFFSYTPPTNSNCSRSTNRSHPTKHKSGSRRNSQTCIRTSASSTSNRREINMVSQELAKINQRSMGTECGVRLPDRLVSKTAPDALHAHAKIFQNRKQKFVARGRRNDDEECHRGSQTCKRSIRRTHFSPAEKVGKVSAHFQPMTVEPICSVRTLQDGRGPDVDHDDTTKRLDGVNGSTGRLLLRSSAPKSQKVSSVLVGGHIVPVSVTPIRPLVLSSSVYQAVEASGSISETTRSSLLIYLDDILLLNQSQAELEKDKCSVLFLLHKLGFAVNQKKSMLIPSQKMEYLGFVIDSGRLTLSLPPEKVTKIQEECRQVLQQRSVRVCQLSHLIGMLTATILAVLPAPLHYRHLQMQKSKALLAGHQNYNAQVVLDLECKSELKWWFRHLQDWNGKSLISPAPDLVITTDSSMMGWGAVCNGTTTQGLWSPSEKLNHINVLELKAAMFAVMAFAKNLSQIHIHLRLDNQASVAQINKFGGPRSHRLFQITKVFWDFCLSRQIIITADHVPGVQNQIADRESRVFLDKSCWILNRSYFQQIEKIWGEADIDLFVDRLTTQKKVYVSWKPDPKALTTDAFTMQWADQKMYAFPPFCLVGLCLAKVRRDQASLTLIAPVWPAQTWYPTLLEMSVSAPILLPALEDLLHSPQGVPHPLILSYGLTLAAWRVSGVGSKQQVFRKNLQICSWNQDVLVQGQHTRPLGKDGGAGVWRGRLTPFRPLWDM